MKSLKSLNNHKLIMEGWRKFLLTEAPVVPSGGPPVAQDKNTLPQELKNMSSVDLTSWVKSLNSNKADVLNTLFAGLKDANPTDDAVKITSGVAVPCVNLIPTQSEVVLDSSLGFTLKNPAAFAKYIKGNGPFKVGAPGNDAIVILNNRFIIDGHHRWSSLYCVNPKAQIIAFNIQVSLNPKTVLKLVQASVKASLPPGAPMPTNPGGGTNLFTISDNELFNYIREKITPAQAQLFVKTGAVSTDQRAGTVREPAPGAEQKVAEAADKLTSYVTNTLFRIIKTNVDLMKVNNKPISGATPRPVMPQLDDVPGSKVTAGGPTPKALEPLEKGMINFKPPYKP
jgi:hypothetical protein